MKMRPALPCPACTVRCMCVCVWRAGQGRPLTYLWTSTIYLHPDVMSFYAGLLFTPLARVQSSRISEYLPGVPACLPAAGAD